MRLQVKMLRNMWVLTSKRFYHVYDVTWSGGSQLKAWSTTMAQPVETTAILNAQPLWMLLETNTLWCFKSVADLCFMGPFAVLGNAKYQYRPLRACRKMIQRWELWRTYRHTDATKQFLQFDLELWPTTLTYNPSLAKVRVDPHTKNHGHRSNGSDRRARTDKQAHRQTNGRYQTHCLPCFAIDKERLIKFCMQKLCW